MEVRTMMKVNVPGICRFLGAPTLVISVWCTVVPDASAAVRYRANGTICQPEVIWFEDDYTYRSDGLEGLTIKDSTSGNSSIGAVACPLPTGTDLIELADDNNRILDRVSARFKLSGSSESMFAELNANDYDSDDFCTCDHDDRSGSAGYFSMTLDYEGDGDSTGCDTGCHGGPVEAAWGLTMEVFLDDTSGGSINSLVVKLISVYDTDI
jgi:hypothetical protein